MILSTGTDKAGQYKPRSRSTLFISASLGHITIILKHQNIQDFKVKLREIISLLIKSALSWSITLLPIIHLFYFFIYSIFHAFFVFDSNAADATLFTMT